MGVSAMTSRERVVRCLQFEHPDRAPRDLWTLPGVEMFRQEELQALLQRFPRDITWAEYRYGAARRTKGKPNRIGVYVDEWGCAWSAAEDGVVGEVKHHPLADWSALASYTAPWEVLEEADLSCVSASCAATERFVLINTSVRLFERMQFLRGTETFYFDLAYQPAELFALRDLVHEYYLREISLWAESDVDGIFFMDDWGAQSNLLISPELWREFFKPLYREYCEMIRKAGKFVFFHSDGFIGAIIPDLIEIGVHALNSQLFCMDIEELGRRHKGRITFWGEICRQHVLPFGTEQEVREAVLRLRRAFDDEAGGVIAHCEWGNQDPMANIAAVFEAWELPRPAI